jgi:hypothetical protein
MATTPKASWPWVKTLLHSVYHKPDAASVHDQYDRLTGAIFFYALAATTNEGGRYVAGQMTRPAAE